MCRFRTGLVYAGMLLLSFSSLSAFSESEEEFYLRRSEARADLHTGGRVVYDGETDRLDFRLTDLQVASLNGHELMLLRNSIFARHGYMFRNGTIGEHFMTFDWYRPVNEDVDSLLNATDLWNIRLIRHYEDHLTDDGSAPPEEADLTGFWHGSASVGSGYSERYLLFDDGSFIYRTSSMDGSARLDELSGEWSIDGCHLVLLADTMTFLRGGRIEEPYASWGSEYVIDGATSVCLELPPGEVFRLPLEAYTPNYAESSGDEEFEHLTVPYMWIGYGEFWRMHSDPEIDVY